MKGLYNENVKYLKNLKNGNQHFSWITITNILKMNIFLKAVYILNLTWLKDQCMLHRNRT